MGICILWPITRQATKCKFISIREYPFHGPSKPVPEWSVTSDQSNVAAAHGHCHPTELWADAPIGALDLFVPAVNSDLRDQWHAVT